MASYQSKLDSLRTKDPVLLSAIETQYSYTIHGSGDCLAILETMVTQQGNGIKIDPKQIRLVKDLFESLVKLREPGLSTRAISPYWEKYHDLTSTLGVNETEEILSQLRAVNTSNRSRKPRQFSGSYMLPFSQALQS